MNRTLVAGVDSSTQSCKVVVPSAGTRRCGRHGLAPLAVGVQPVPGPVAPVLLPDLGQGEPAGAQYGRM